MLTTYYIYKHKIYYYFILNHFLSPILKTHFFLSSVMMIQRMLNISVRKFLIDIYTHALCVIYIVFIIETYVYRNA